MNDNLSRHDKISLALHASVKRELLANPQEVIQTAKRNLNKWEASYGGEQQWMVEWSTILGNGIEAIVAVLDGTDEHSVLLRSNSPFTGVISQQERDDILKKFMSNNGKSQKLKGSVAHYERPTDPVWPEEDC